MKKIIDSVLCGILGFFIDILFLLMIVIVLLLTPVALILLIPISIIGILFRMIEE